MAHLAKTLIGLSGESFESADTLIALKYIPELIMVFPDGNGRPGATSEWGNSYDQHQLMENFVANDLVKYIDQHYRTIPDTQHRGIGGLSMGGFGAMNIAIHHPDVFGNVMSFGGYYKAEGSIWGSNTYYQQLNSPLSTIVKMPQAWQLQIFLGAATKDQPYYRDTLQFRQVLDQLHIHYHFDLQVGQHSWRVWQKQMYNALANELPWNGNAILCPYKATTPTNMRPCSSNGSMTFGNLRETDYTQRAHYGILLMHNHATFSEKVRYCVTRQSIVS